MAVFFLLNPLSSPINFTKNIYLKSIYLSPSYLSASQPIPPSSLSWTTGTFYTVSMLILVSL